MCKWIIATQSNEADDRESKGETINTIWGSYRGDILIMSQKKKKQTICKGVKVGDR